MTTGSVLAQFTVTLSQAVSEQVAVEWHTADGTALAGVDYAAAKGTVLFAPGQTAKTVDILVHGRAVGSEDRSFFVEMLPPTNAILGASIGECIIHVDTTGSTPVTQIIVPTGPQGLQGDSAYQAWLDLGNTGTEEDFINSLKPSAEEIVEEVAPILNVSNSPLTAEGTETLSKPDTMTGKRLARRVAYVGAAKVATAVLADGDNLITHAALSGDAVDFNSISLHPRILRGTVVISPEWSVEPGDKILIKSAVAGDVLHVCQYDVISERAVKNVVEPLVSAALAPVSAAVAKAGSQAFESLRRSYAEAGYNVVGTFRAGFTYVNANDVGIDETTGKGFTGPAGMVAAGTDPTSGGFADVSSHVDKSILASSVKTLHLSCKTLVTTGFSANGVGGDSYIFDSTLSSGSKAGVDPEFTGGAFVLYDAKGRAYKRIYSKKCHPECFGFAEGIDCVPLLESIQDYCYINGGGDMGPQIDGTVFTVSRRFDLKGGVDFSGRFTFHHTATVGSPENRIFNLRSDVKEAIQIGPLAAGTTDFTFPRASELTLGERVLVMGGRDPFDPNEEKMRYFAQVVDTSGGRLTLSVPCPDNMGSLTPAEGHRVIRFNRLNIGTVVGDITFTRANNSGLVDIAFICQYCIAPSIGELTAGNDDFTLCELRESDSPNVKGVVRALGENAFSSSGRLLAGWGCPGAFVGYVRGTSETGLIFAESSQEITIGSVEGKTLSSTLNAIGANGGSKITIGRYVFSQGSTAVPAIAENQNSQVICKDVTLTATPKSCVLRGVERLRLPQLPSVLSNATMCYIKVDIPTNGTITVPLGYGVSTELNVSLFSSTGVTSVYFGDNPINSTASNILSRITANNRWTPISIFGRYGTDYPTNVIGTKNIIINTSGSPSGNYLLVACRLIS